jgi:CubicO group peptidase (beta-lactamase class C family)
VFPLGSISKQFTAAAILALADAGKLRLDARVGEYLPEWFAGDPGLRVSHLLAQSSGLADFLWLEGYRPLANEAATPISAYVALAAAAPRRFAPGTRWAYSNTNYKALALIAERVAGEPFDRVLYDTVLKPAGIEGVVACHSLRPDQFVPGVSGDGKPAPLDASAAAYIGDGGLCAGAAALSQWLRRVLASPDARASRLARPNVLADGTQVPYGFGLSTREFLGRRMVWHGGNVDSHSTMLAYLPDEDIGLVILTAKGFVWLTELMPALIGAAPPARAAAPGAPLSGRFEDGLFRFEVTPEGEALQVKIDLIDRIRFVPAGPREYIAEKLPATFRIRLPADASHDRFEFDWGEVRSYARPVKE